MMDSTDALLTYNWLPRSRLHKDLRNHFVLVNSEHYVRTIMTDSDNFSIIDHESIVKEFNLSDNSLATFENVYSDASSKLVSENDRKKVVFGKIPGTV